MKKVEVQNPNKLPAQVIADAIVRVAAAMKTINESRLRRVAVVALIHDQSGISKKTINIILNNLDELERDWLKPK